jgi:hypothetical protein
MLICFRYTTMYVALLLFAVALAAVPACRFSRISITLDPGIAKQSTISTDGGMISTTGADGTKYTLEIPAGALAGETQISITPVKSLTGLPFGGPSYSVQLGPQGLFLYDFATLTIVPPEKISPEEQLFFQFSDDGKVLDPAIPVDGSSDLKIRVGHFSGFGISRTNAAERAAFLEQRAADAERRLGQSVAAFLQNKRNNGSSAQIPWEEIFKNYEEQVIKPRIESAAASCENGEKALESIMEYKRQRQLSGAPGDTGNDKPSSFDAETLTLIETMAQKCEEEAKIECKAKKDPKILIIFELGAAGTQQRLGMPSQDIQRIVDEANAICLGSRTPGGRTPAGSAYEASGGVKIKVSGTVCDLGKSFQLTGIGNNGITYNFDFSPASSTSGSMNYSGSASGCTESGSGSYTVKFDDDGMTGKVECKVSGRVTCRGVGGSFSCSEDFVLTAVPSASCH